jgi:hypothetical protein
VPALDVSPLRILVTPGFHVLLCGPTSAWPSTVDSEMQQRRPGLVTGHRPTPDEAPGVLHDRDGIALNRLGVRRAPECLLVRPDGHVGHRSRGRDLTAALAYLARWLPRQPGTTPQEN